MNILCDDGNGLNFDKYLSSPSYRNFYNENYKKINDFYNKITERGYNDVEFVFKEL